MNTRQINSGRIVQFGIMAFFVAAMVNGDSLATVNAQNADKKGEQRFTMDFTNAKWREVLEWYVDKTKKEFISSIPPPPGTFSHATPKGTNYSLLEITGIINDALLKQDYVLVPREKSITLLKIAK